MIVSTNDGKNAASHSVAAIATVAVDIIVDLVADVARPLLAVERRKIGVPFLERVDKPRADREPLCFQVGTLLLGHQGISEEVH